ncbi:MAG: hypothetical protein IPK32_26360 [Verrucomicrobiaceae bacterium]|nr:hypothetical protein [Verrucomicrobiaceae bacterium]
MMRLLRIEEFASRSTAGYAHYGQCRTTFNPRLREFDGQVERTLKHGSPISSPSSPLRTPPQYRAPWSRVACRLRRPAYPWARRRRPSAGYACLFFVGG